VSSAISSVGSVVCLALGLANLAWVDLILVPAYLSAGSARGAGPQTRRAAPPPAPRPRRADPADAGRAIVVAEPDPRRAEPDPRRAEPDPRRAEPDPRRAERRALLRRRGDQETPRVRRWTAHFRHGRSDLGRRARAVLRAALDVACAPACRGRIRLEGHTDPSGSRAFNRRLSRKRARRVRRWLVRHGFAPASIDTRARGEDGPLPEGHDAKSWAARRRVDIEWRSP
jgi:outer membrane protein OmpA-like peptidoglycan-associated protein